MVVGGFYLYPARWSLQLSIGTELRFGANQIVHAQQKIAQEELLLYI